MEAPTRPAGRSHLLRHTLPDIKDLAEYFGSEDPKDIARDIAKMGQKELQVGSDQLRWCAVPELI